MTLKHSGKAIAVVLAGAFALASATAADARLRRGTAALIVGGVVAGALVAGALNAQAKPVRHCVKRKVWVINEDGDRYRVWRRVCS
jgi:predicted acylesterase/phospholipase RssA